MTTDNLETCVWKEIAERDLNKPDAIKTLAPDKECYSCNGYNTECKQYYTLGGNGDESKYKI